MAVITGTFNSLVSGTITGVFQNTAGGVLSGVIGTPGPAGATGAAGPAGPAGEPGQGVPTGGLASQVLAKIDGQDFNTEWVDQSGAVVWGDIGGEISNQGDLVLVLAEKLDVTTAAATYYLKTNPNGFITVSALTGYATQSWVTAGFYPLSGNPSGFLTASALTPYLTKAGNLSGLTNLTTARDNLNLGTANTPVFAGLTAQGSAGNIAQLTPTSLTITHAGSGIFTIQPSQGIVFPDATVQTTAYPGPVGATQWGSIGGSLINQTDLYNSLAAKFDHAGGAIDANGSITASDTSTATDSELAGWGLGVQLSADHTKGTTVEFDGLDTYDGSSHMQVTPTGLTFPDATVQTTAGIPDSPSDSQTYGRNNGAWVVAGGSSFITSVTFPLAVNSDDLSIDLAGYATEGWVTTQGYITQATADGLYYPRSGNPSGFVTAGNLADYAELAGAAFTGPISTSDTVRVGSFNPDPTPAATGQIWFHQLFGKLRFYDGTSTKSVASEAWSSAAFYPLSYNPSGYLVAADITGKANLASATFTGKVNFATLGVGIPSVNLGGQCDPAPASATNGDLWISNATAPKLTYRMGGVNYNLPVLNQFNTFTNQVVIDSSSSVTPTLRVTQRGSGPTLVVEDSTTPDTNALVVDTSGNVGIGVASGYTATQKVEVVGNVKADAFINGSGPTYKVNAIQAHSGGADTHELLMSVNGSTYRVGMRFVSTP